VVFDPDTISERATYDEPKRSPQGIYHVLVNGTPVIEAGVHRGERAGAVIRGRHG
jgi:N-acyl-D-amino-acid deacylase